MTPRETSETNGKGSRGARLTLDADLKNLTLKRPRHREVRQL
jgi:hypothetical protein